jgi:hypothetical protein
MLTVHEESKTANATYIGSTIFQVCVTVFFLFPLFYTHKY